MTHRYRTSSVSRSPDGKTGKTKISTGSRNAIGCADSYKTATTGLRLITHKLAIRLQPLLE